MAMCAKRQKIITKEFSHAAHGTKHFIVFQVNLVFIIKKIHIVSKFKKDECSLRSYYIIFILNTILRT